MSTAYANAPTALIVSNTKKNVVERRKNFTPYLVLIAQCYHLGKLVQTKAVLIKNTAVQITKELVEQTWTRVGN